MTFSLKARYSNTTVSLLTEGIGAAFLPNLSGDAQALRQTDLSYNRDYCMVNSQILPLQRTTPGSRD